MQFVSATLIDFTPISWLYVGTAANWVDVDDMQRRSAHTTARYSPLQLSSSSSNNKRSHNNNNNSNEKANFCRGAQQRAAAAAASKWKREQESCTHTHARTYTRPCVSRVSCRMRECVWAPTQQYGRPFFANYQGVDGHQAQCAAANGANCLR